MLSDIKYPKAKTDVRRKATQRYWYRFFFNIIGTATQWEQSEENCLNILSL